MDKKVFSVYMGNSGNHNHAELELPAAPWELLDALDKLRLEDGQQFYWQVEDMGRYLSEYALEPGIHSLEELAREELSVIVSDPDRDLLTRHLNMEAYGADLLWRDQGLFSDYGYICRPDGQPLQVPRQGVDMTMQ